MKAIELNTNELKQLIRFTISNNKFLQDNNKKSISLNVVGEAELVRLQV